MWCDNCNCAVEPVTSKYFEQYGEFEKEEIAYSCPYCGKEVYDTATKCGCGEYMKDGEYCCGECLYGIDEALEEIASWLTDRGHADARYLIQERIAEWD